MKKANFIVLFVTLIILSFNATSSFAQVQTDPRTEEYATIRAVLSAQTGTFSTTTTLLNPFLEIEGMAMELKDIVKDPKGVKFENVTEMINYMNKFSWTLLNSVTADIAGSKTNDFIILYTFKRKPKNK